MSRRRGPDWAVLAPAAVLLAMVGATAATLATLSLEPGIDEVADRYVQVAVVDGATPTAEPAEALWVDGTSAAQRQVAGAAEPSGPELQKVSLDRQIAEDAGVLGALREPDGDALGGGAGIGSGIGGLIGTKGVQVGAGGLRTRGSGIGGARGTHGTGIGGGGSAEGIGGLGVRGIGSGASGYGSGGGSYAVGSGGGSYAVGRGGGSYAVGSGGGSYAVGSGGGTYGHGGALVHGGPATTIDHGVNPVELSSQDNLSTFAVDVDTGSFTLARATLRDGALPHPDSVRVEEFVNALDYSLAPPKNGLPFATHVEATPNPHARGHHMLRVSLKGVEPHIDEAPARLTFLVDTSCSMSGERIDLVKRSLHVLVDHAGSEDSIAIATYAGSTREILQPTPANRRRTVHAAIDSLGTQGGTAMNDGMVLAYRMASDHFLPGAENRVVVLSDGDANIGRSSHQAILDSISEHAGNGITLSTVGFGRGNYRDAMMEQLADKGDGNYVYIDSIDEARKVFGEKLGGLTRTIARDVKVQVDFDPDAVLAWRLIGYENRDVADEDFRNDAVDGGEIGAGHEVTALYDVVLADELDDTIGTVHLRAKPPGKDAPAVEWNVPFRTESIHAEWGDASRDLRVASATALFAEILRHSPHVEELTLDDVLDMLAPVAPTQEIRGLREMVLRAKQLTAPATVANIETTAAGLTP